MAIELHKLPYALDALEPYIGAETVFIHHHRHQWAYVEKTNALLKRTQWANKPLEELITLAAPRSRRTVLYNNAAQV